MKFYKNNKLIINRLSNYYKSILGSVRDALISFIAFYFIVVNELCLLLSQYSSLTITISFSSDGNGSDNSGGTSGRVDEDSGNTSIGSDGISIINISSNHQCNQESFDKSTLASDTIKPQHITLNIDDIK